VNEGPPGREATVLLVLASRDAKSVAQLAAASGLSPVAIVQQLQRLSRQGFIIAASPDDADVSVYRLNPKGERTEGLHPHERILLVDDADALRALMTVILEGEGYVVIATAFQADAVTLLREVAFDLVITDSFSPVPGAALMSATELLAAAGDTPVALFSAHRLPLAPVQAAGFRDLIQKPFDIDLLTLQVRALMGR
jgi:CheY-like chemotaxis protein